MVEEKSLSGRFVEIRFTLVSETYFKCHCINGEENNPYQNDKHSMFLLCEGWVCGEGVFVWVCVGVCVSHGFTNLIVLYFKNQELKMYQALH